MIINHLQLYEHRLFRTVVILPIISMLLLMETTWGDTLPNTQVDNNYIKDKYSVTIINGWYAINDKHGKLLHDPIPYEIYRDDIETHLYNGIAYSIYRFLYLDQHGATHVALVIEPGKVFTGFVFGEVFAFSEGLAVACYDLDRVRDGDGDGYGYIGLDGNEIIPFQWVWCESFIDGKALVTYEATNRYASLIIDKNGIVIQIPPITEE